MTVDRLYMLQVNNVEGKNYNFIFQADDYSTDGMLKEETYSLLCEKLSTLDTETSRPQAQPVNLDTLMKDLEQYKLSISYGMCSGFEGENVEERWVESEYTEPQKEKDNQISLEKDEENG